MRCITYFKKERWYVTKIGFKKSFVRIGIERKTGRDFIIQIPNKIYNKIVNNEYVIHFLESYKKDEYDKKEMLLIENNNVKEKLLFYEEIL